MTCVHDYKGRPRRGTHEDGSGKARDISGSLSKISHDVDWTHKQFSNQRCKFVLMCVHQFRVHNRSIKYRRNARREMSARVSDTDATTLVGA